MYLIEYQPGLVIDADRIYDLDITRINEGVVEFNIDCSILTYTVAKELLCEFMSAMDDRHEGSISLLDRAVDPER